MKKYTISAVMPMYVHIDGIEIEAETEDEAREIFEINLEKDKYHHDICKGIEAATESLAWTGALEAVEVIIE